MKLEGYDLGLHGLQLRLRVKAAQAFIDWLPITNKPAMASTQSILETNLVQLSHTAPGLARRLRQATPTPLQWQASRSGPLTASVDTGGHSLALASRHDPMAEAGKMVAKIDLKKHAGVIVLGLGLGYHVQLLSELINSNVLVIVYEPDLSLFRAVLERIDHTRWLGQPNMVVVGEQVDRAALIGRIDRFSGTLAQGTILLTHPPTRQLHGAQIDQFGRAIGDVLSYCRTNIATALVNASRTIYNLTMNLHQYAAGAVTDELLNVASGYPAVCVGAGPSLVRNIDLLSDPKVRSNVVIISAQTTLKPLLDRGIRPDYVTALDYSMISQRFYEGLEALPEVTLVAEPLAHPTILDAFPGPKRVTANRFLDQLLGEEARPIVPMASGTTVAHLSFYLAQHLGCDPIILIGQDLGFSDGLYYCPGTAIHDVWSGELGPFNTLEMMEWQRIVRHRGHLQKMEGIHGQPVYTDEQMRTYLKQFERDFSAAKQTVLDATEGGLAKQHVTRVTLHEALHKYATRTVPAMPIPPYQLDPQRLAKAVDVMASRIEQVADLRRLSCKTLPILKQMRAKQHDPVQMSKLFERLAPLRRGVEQLGEVFGIVNGLNTVGAFKRARADRAIENAGADAWDEQRQRLDRDIENVDWLIQACDEASGIFCSALDNLQQRHKQLGSQQAAAA